MDTVPEFHYRLRARAGGHRPGSHPGSTLGAGQEYATLGRLLDAPDPRRIDIHASLRSPRREWLVRHFRQRAAVTVHALVDVSPSMDFGVGRSKSEVATEFVEALGYSAFRAGDPAGLLAFDTEERLDLYVPPRCARGMGTVMSVALRNFPRTRGDVRRTGPALRDTAARLAGRSGLFFLLSDFHWPLDTLADTLDSLLAHGPVIPVVVWDPSEVEPPSRDGLLAMVDAESGVRRTVLMRAAVRRQWRDRMVLRCGEIDTLLAARGLRPLHLRGRFDAEQVTRYFLEEALA